MWIGLAAGSALRLESRNRFLQVRPQKNRAADQCHVRIKTRNMADQEERDLSTQLARPVEIPPPSGSQISILHRISSIVSSDLTLDKMLQELVGLTLQVTACDACLVYL